MTYRGRIIFFLPIIFFKVTLSCLNGWTEFNEFCYLLSHDETHWLAAEDACNEFGGNLMKSYWSLTNCGEKEKYICKVKKGVTPSPKPTSVTPVPTGHCPLGWLESLKKCFKIYFLDEINGLSFIEVRNRCMSLNVMSNLATINSQEENSFIVSKTINTQYGNGLWFGLLRDDKHSPWLWTDNSPKTVNDYNNFYTRYPKENNAYLSTHADAFRSGKWMADTYSTNKKGYVCSMSKRMYIRFIWEGGDKSPLKKMNMASIHSPELNEGLCYHVMNTENYYWIGMNRFNDTDAFKWSDHSTVVFTKWMEFPKNDKNCAAISSKGLWHGFPCNTQLESICKILYGSALTTPSQVSGLCPSPTKGEWISHGSYCYIFSKDTAFTAQEALQKCIRKSSANARLVSIQDFSEQVWLTFMLRRIEQHSTHWIGLTRQSPDHSFTWMDDSPVTFEYWKKYDTSAGNCVVLSVQDSEKATGFWSKRLCSNSNKLPPKYICKVPKIPLPSTPAPVKGKCPPQLSNNDVWELFGNKCFLFRRGQFADYQQAAQVCSRVNGTLAEIRSFDENFFMEEYAKKHFPSFMKGLWIGLSKTNTSNYIWQNGHKLDYEYWYNLDDKKGNCVSLNTSLNGHWTSHSCYRNYLPFVCQADMIKDSSGRTIGAKVGLGLGIAIALCVLIGIFGGAIYKWQSSREPPTKTFHNRGSSFASTNEVSKYFKETTA
ncbi:DgyrCDS14817 [Dimorphilus gyrociliatus]|uniref:DgyrCDS14817 n=1 Tax=Dimorphilus gyrociliatus TaxID=2664684 RepID=A0A7I8WEY3_9ANNE|nr:DgyrCDS14817 [Dimorphilus gyrociliatus]